MLAAILTLTPLLSRPAFAQDAVKPYTKDAHTLHLWHLDEASGPEYADAAGDLPLSASAATGEKSYSGLERAFASTAENSVFLTSKSRVTWAEAMLGPDGAFTWEMVLRPDMPADAGQTESRQITAMLLAGPGFYLKFSYVQDGSVWLSLYRLDEATNGLNVRLDKLQGERKYEPGRWYHLAVTFDGVSNGTAYWTPLGSGPAAKLKDYSMTPLPGGNQPVAFGGVLNQFVGAIDEIRISDTAREPDQFLTTPANH